MIIKYYNVLYYYNDYNVNIEVMKYTNVFYLLLFYINALQCNVFNSILNVCAVLLLLTGIWLISVNDIIILYNKKYN